MVNKTPVTEYAVMYPRISMTEPHRGPLSEKEVDDWIKEAESDGFARGVVQKWSRRVGPWTPHQEAVEDGLSTEGRNLLRAYEGIGSPHDLLVALRRSMILTDYINNQPPTIREAWLAHLKEKNAL